MTVIPNPQFTAQDRFQWLREIFTAVIATLIIGGTIGLFAYAAIANKTDAKNLQAILSLVSAPLGVVLGFFFNKTSTDTQLARADASVQQANAAKTTAEQTAQRTQSTLRQLRDAAMQHISNQPDSTSPPMGLRSAIEGANGLLGEL